MKQKKTPGNQLGKKRAIKPATSQVKLELITYYIDGKKKTVLAKKLTTPWQMARGLMFKKTSPPLLFTSRIRYNPITSLFCMPFKAIWLDKNFHATKVIDVKTWKININGYGKYLLEIPLQ